MTLALVVMLAIFLGIIAYGATGKWWVAFLVGCPMPIAVVGSIYYGIKRRKGKADDGDAT